MGAQEGTFSGKRVLIADDDADTRVIVSSVISILGYSPIVVADGFEAVQSCSEQMPDLVIVDYMMPGLTGLEVCQRLKRQPGGQYVPVLMLTARDTVQDKVSALEEGVDDYLTKPFNYQELQARVKALLRVRDLNVRLQETNAELYRMQERLIEQERQLVVGQLAGTAAHQLGQPLSAILLNCYLLEHLPKDDSKFVGALQSIKGDAKRMADMIGKLRAVDASKKEEYYGETEILSLGPDTAGQPDTCEKPNAKKGKEKP
jgi:DNA-binding response OmpR family regulator